VRLRWDDIIPGRDVVCIARRPIANATFQDVQAACEQLLDQAGLLKNAKRSSSRQHDQEALS
jgi:RNase P protein component